MNDNRQPIAVARDPASRFRGLAENFSDVRFLRFLATGVLNTLFGFGIYYTLLLLTGHAIIALSIGTVIGMIFNFVTIGRVVFNSSDYRLLHRFVLVYVAVYLYNAAGISLLGLFGVGPALAGFLNLPGAAMVSWFLNSRFVFTATSGVRPALRATNHA